MTTIAWDGKTLAADGLSTMGTQVVSTTKQKIKVNNGIDKWRVCGHEVVCAAVAGDTGAGLLIADLLGADATPESKVPEHYDFVMIAVCRYGGDAFLLASSENSPHLHITRLTGPYAIGNGDVIALTAMKCGKDARGAVELACELNVYTGGTITEWSR